MYDVAVIGAGVIGTFIARELSRYDLKIVIVEKDNDVANGTTKANSAIVHAGYDADYDSLKGKLNALGNSMFDKVCSELDVPFKRIGSLVLGFDDEDMKTLDKLYKNGLKLNIPDLKILNGDEARALEPNISENVVGALQAPTAGIVGPWELAVALAENAVENGVEIRLNNEVKNINKTTDGYKITTNDGEIDAKYVINCAGVYADKINAMVAEPEFKITPRKGQYYLLDKSAGNLFNSVIFQCPTKLGKGVLITPTVHGNLLVGPDSQDIDDKEDISTTSDRMNLVREYAAKSCDNIPFNQVITSFAGLRAEPTGGDFIIAEAKDAKGFINVAGIKSPGLSASPAIADYVVKLLFDITGDIKENKNFNPVRRPVIRFMELTDEQKAEVIKKDSRYGRIICRCENITEGEIVDIIQRKVGARTVDGVKRRARPGMGRCQGGFCGPRVMEILARELDVDISTIVKSEKNSYIITNETKTN
ncbi:NAD(P)/FAD-dependent oxidoreductase [Abyssisolibacter fermentans]|uniref:NAD(P)/FAD-dependent oxidoreductase n=1 Tax=Abyssisolibacter fermentans TaxID=1766203 RepID=UPI0008359D60|nr:NAD(P)/FAD-dependent oxidoreductase [Abyssisolibacter fermentans]